MNTSAAALQAPTLEIRFGQVSLPQVRIRTTDPGTILDELTGRVASAPRFFERTAVCLDLSALEKEPDAAEVRAVLSAISRAGMVTAGLAHSTAAVDALAQALELPVLTYFRAPPNKAPPILQPADPAPQEFAKPALMNHSPVRSGQRVYARHRDLVVTATVGAGAEVMADGCVHVYGALRGRAMAGGKRRSHRPGVLSGVLRGACLGGRRVPRVRDHSAGAEGPSRAGLAFRRRAPLRPRRRVRVTSPKASA
ncbi:MAG: septum site-determining protein MinC [Gammaproteobacteria bacterium]